MRELVRTSGYVMTAHGVEEMEADELTVFDLEHCILTGRIIERQKDRGTGEWKYLIRGKTLGDDTAVVVAKIGPTGKLVMITVYLM
jgi:hypothetical protein